MSQRYIPVPDAVQTGPNGVFPGEGMLSVDEWVQLYLVEGLHWHDWLGQRRTGQQAIAFELRTQVEAAELAGNETLIPYIPRRNTGDCRATTWQAEVNQQAGEG